MTNRPDFRESVYEAIDAVRELQDLKWHREPGRWNEPPFVKLSVLMEKAGDVALALNDGKPEQASADLLQVAAVVVCWLETIERLERDKRRKMPECSKDNPCCSRRGEYNGFGSGPELFTCPKSCACHD